MKVLELKSLFHEDLSNHYSVEWLKAHEAHFSRERTLETAVFGPTIYRPLKELGGPGMSAEPPKHRTNMARMRVTIHVAIQSETPCEPKNPRQRKYRKLCRLCSPRWSKYES